MWQTKKPTPVRLIVGILAADDESRKRAIEKLEEIYGRADLLSEVWPFTMTTYYKAETGAQILRQFASFEKLIDPGELAEIKHQTNKMEQELAEELKRDVPRPVNLDPGLIEPAKLVLATTKNYAHRIYIGNEMWAEVTLIFDKGQWRALPYTYPDYKLAEYQEFFERVRKKLLEQLKTD
jgi:hypothetical protein